MVGVFPAWAGVDRRDYKNGNRRVSIPRVGGGRPIDGAVWQAEYQYSPRGRG